MSRLRKYVETNWQTWADMTSVYSFFNLKKGKPCVIAPFNLISRKGGLADRLRHCLSLYLFCKKYNLIFKIEHYDPFDLSLFLAPNQYDWEIDQNDFCKSFLRTKRINLWSGYKSLGITEEHESKIQEKSLIKILSSPSKQYHIYGNLHLYKEEWKNAFNELFKPSPIIEERLKYVKNKKYDAVTFRFQQLLGDFEEGDFPVLPQKEQFKLITQCVDELKLKYQEGFFKSNLILVTSDSWTFLKEVKKLSFVIVNEGKVYHPGYSSENADAYIKSFVDLYSLMYAESVYLFKRSDMFLSGFPEFAAIIGGKEFKVHTFNKL